MRTRYWIKRDSPDIEKQPDDIPYGRRVVIALMAIPLLVWGVWLIVVGVRAQIEGESAESWPMVYGDVTRAWVTEETVKDGRLWRSQYTPHVVYEYEVDGKRYEGDRIRVLPVGFEDRWRADGMASWYLNVEPGWSWGDSFARLLVGTMLVSLASLFTWMTRDVWRNWFVAGVGRITDRIRALGQASP